MNKVVIYVHGKGGNAAEAEWYKPLFRDREVVGFDYKAETPWEAKDEFAAYFDSVFQKYADVSVIANSIGAFLMMNAPINGKIRKAYFISPIVDMKKLISGMMAAASVTEEKLRERGEMQTPFGETLSWKYLCYVRDNPLMWEVPTHILYGENDPLTSLDTMAAFAKRTGASLDVMQGGEHWFHTAPQMAYLEKWIRSV